MDRRYDLDWLRIGAFGLLILYHVGMFYVTWDWHVKSSHAGPAIEPLMLAVNPWRLTLLFVISGAATRFMADKMAPGPLLGSRTWRLLPPLLFGMFVIVPPQSYFQIVEQIGYAGSFGDFYPKYATGSGHWRLADGYLFTPTYNHLWFVAYLFLYTLALIPLLPLLRRLPKLPAAIGTPLALLAPAIFLWLTRSILLPQFGETHDFRDDPYVHTLSFAAFLFGFQIAKQQSFFDACVRWRYAALVVATLSYAGVLAAWANQEALRALPDTTIFFLRGVRELQAWGAIVALIGFAHRYLRNADGPVRRYLTLGIFPFYIAHQTAIVVAGYFLNRLGWPVWLEAVCLIALTAGACALTYEVARRIAPLRPLFGLKFREAQVKPVEPDLATTQIPLGA